MKHLLVALTLSLLSTTPAWSMPRHCDSLAKDSTEVKKNDEKNKKQPEKKETEYEKLIKKGGSFQQGLFGVRHIEKDWFFEIPEAALGRLFLAVTRFVSVPQDFGLLSGEEVNNNTVYFERYDDKTLFLRSWAHTQSADPKSNIATLVKKSTIDPIVYKFDIIGKDNKTGNMLINVTKLFKGDNKIGGFTASDRTETKLGGLQDDRTFIDTIKAYPINIEVSTLRTYAATPGKSMASRDGFMTLSLNTSIVELPEKPMRPRLGDERVGYFNKPLVTFSYR